jgi:hypothetical protein
VIIKFFGGRRGREKEKESDTMAVEERKKLWLLFYEGMIFNFS